MKDICKIILICLFFTSCSKKAEKVENSKVLDTVSKMKTIEFEHSVAVIVPANYMKRMTAGSGMKTDYFTPDEKTIKYIEKRLPETQSIINQVWGDSEWQKLLKFDAEYMSKYDKQYIGFVNSKKDSIISIYLVNFESDPTARICNPCSQYTSFL